MLHQRVNGKSDLRAFRLLAEADHARARKDFKRADMLEGEAEALAVEDDFVLQQEESDQVQRHIQKLIKRPQVKFVKTDQKPQRADNGGKWKPLLLLKGEELLDPEQQNESTITKAHKQVLLMAGHVPAMLQQALPRMGQRSMSLSEERGVSTVLASGGASLVAADPASGAMMLLLGVALEAVNSLEDSEEDEKETKEETEVEETAQAEFGWLAPGKGQISGFILRP